MNEGTLPRLLFTIGDVNGIGPEVLLKALRSPALLSCCAPTVIGNGKLLREYAAAAGFSDVTVREEEIGLEGCSIPLVDLPSDAALRPGTNDAQAGKLAGDAIVRAVEMLMEGKADAMVTMPISKEGLNGGGYRWPGHTEMIAHLSGGAEPMMILLTEGLRVALATIHIPLADVPGRITPDLLSRRLATLRRTLRNDFGVAEPRIAVLGLNPHAGENGGIGTEEKNIIGPTLERLRNEGLPTDGPFPADGFFARYNGGDYDGVLAMYHDQGLIPLKMFARGGGVNVTAGLPIVRTSPDHGTAYGIAGKGIADERSTVEAALCAAEICGNRRRNRPHEPSE